MKYVCIHGHFYQPPRENPYLEAIELQDSAYPYHDWNERITAECYAPNAASRILDSENRIIKLLNNYAQISFNFGPTLLSWMKEQAPKVYAAILEADQSSAQRFSGHGSAIAQGYNHMILPLANRRDKVTQVKWGIRDFESRFGTKAGRDVAAGNSRGHRNSRSAGRERNSIHDSRAAAGATHSGEEQLQVRRCKRRAH